MIYYIVKYGTDNEVEVVYTSDDYTTFANIYNKLPFRNLNTVFTYHGVTGFMSEDENYRLLAKCEQNGMYLVIDKNTTQYCVWDRYRIYWWERGC